MKYLVALLVFVSTSAFALGDGGDANQGQAQGQAQGQLQGQAQGQLQGQRQTAVGVGVGVGVGIGGEQGQTQSSTNTNGATASGGTAQAVSNSGATNAGVSQGVTVNNNTPETLRTVGIAPDVIATPTAPCRISVGVSGGWLGGAIGFGSSVEDEGCTLRENARMLYNFGEKAAALKLMCNDAKVAAILAVCPKAEPVAVVSEPEVVASVRP